MFLTNVACGHSASACARQSNAEKLGKTRGLAQEALSVKGHGRAPLHEFAGHGCRKHGAVGTST